MTASPSCLFDHLTSNKLLNPHQSVYCKHYSTETALLYVHDHLINAIGSQKVCYKSNDSFDKVECCFNKVASTLLLVWTGL